MNTTDSKISCPACKMSNEAGAIRCAYCHTPLPHNEQKTVTIKKVQESTGTLPEYFDDYLSAPAYDIERFMDFEISSKGIALIDLESSKLIVTSEDSTFILGRASAEIKISRPLVDLTDFGAIDHGISRVHAMIRKMRGGYQITDLESTNGTWHENQRLVPRKPHPLESGDRIRLGRLNVLVFYLS